MTGYGYVTLKMGAVQIGSVLSEKNNTFRLRFPAGVQQGFLLSAVAIRTLPVSLMPPILGILSPAEIRDVVATFGSLKARSSKAKK